MSAIRDVPKTRLAIFSPTLLTYATCRAIIFPDGKNETDVGSTRDRRSSQHTRNAGS